MDFTREHLIAIFVMKCVCIFLTVTGNVLVILAVLTNSSVRKVANNRFICSLAVSDFFVGAISMPLDTFTEINSCAKHLSVYSQLLLDLQYLLVFATVWNLCIISYDRYHFIIDSLQYSTWMSHFKLACFSFCGWFIPMCFCVAMSVVRLIESPNEPVILIGILLVCVGIPMVVILICYIRIIYFTNKVTRRFHSIGMGAILRRSALRRNCLISLLIVTLYVTWLPSLVYRLHAVVVDRIEEDCDVVNALFWVICCNSLVNPLIYTLFNDKFRRAVFRVLICRFRRPKHGRDQEDEEGNRTKKFRTTEGELPILMGQLPPDMQGTYVKTKMAAVMALVAQRKTPASSPAAGTKKASTEV